MSGALPPLPSRAAAAPSAAQDVPTTASSEAPAPEAQAPKAEALKHVVFAEMAHDDLIAAYQDFKNLEDVKDAVARGFPPQVAHDFERTNRNRPSYMQYLRTVAESAEGGDRKDDPVQPTTQPEPQQITDGQERPLKSAVEIAESRYAQVTGKDLVATLREEQGGNILFQRERVVNPAIPADPGMVIDMPRELVYKWVPAPPKHRAFTPDETANLEQFIQKGWRFYSPELMRQAPNMRGLPWKLGWEPDGEKVRWQDQWLMIRFRDLETRDRLAAIEKANSRSQRKNEPGRHTGQTPDGRDYNYVVHSTGGESTVDRVLRERPDALDAQDREFKLPEDRGRG